MILSGEAIRERLKDKQIFQEGTWVPESIKEASYALRIANNGLLVDGDFYDPGVHYTGAYINIEPGKIAILSTKELLSMPANLVGKIGIRLNYAHQGLIGLMSIQVDPLYGREEAKSLFIRVANFGNEPIRLSPGDDVFTFELHTVVGRTVALPPKEPTWPRLKNHLKYQTNSSWSYLTQVKQDLSDETAGIRDYLQPLVMFGVFLVAVTILGVSISVILNLREIPPTQVPDWVTDWAWAVLLITMSIATVATAWIGFTAGWRILHPYRLNRPTSRKRPWWKCWQIRGRRPCRRDNY